MEGYETIKALKKTFEGEGYTVRTLTFRTSFTNSYEKVKELDEDIIITTEVWGRNDRVIKGKWVENNRLSLICGYPMTDKDHAKIKATLKKLGIPYEGGEDRFRAFRLKGLWPNERRG